jgi:hypothetical protein
MKLLPDPGPQRRRLFLMIGALVVIYVVLSKFAGGEPLPIPQTTGPAATSKPIVRTSGPNTRSQSKKADATMPVALKLKQIEEVPDEPEAGRNLFRFGVPPPPPYVAPPPLPPPPPRVDPGPPPPPPIPPIPLTLTWVYSESEPRRAYLADKNTGAVFEATQGQVVDGRYKLLAVGTTSVVMSYLDGTGQRTIPMGGR